MSIYRNIFKKSLELTLKNKYLWFFGLFASFIGLTGEYEFLFKSLRGDTGQSFMLGMNRYADTGIFSTNIFYNVLALFKDNAVSMIMILVLLVILLALFIFLAWLAIVSQAALVNNSANVLTGKKADFKGGVAAGINVFWPVLSMNILIKILMSAIFLIIALPFVLRNTNGGGVYAGLMYLFLFIIFVPIGLVLAFIIKYAIAYLVIKKESFIDSIKSGWELFRANWLASIEMAFILFFINVFATFAVIILVLVIAVPLLFLALLFNYLFSNIGFWILFVIGLILISAILMVGVAMITVFHITSWTGLFVELTGKGVTSKISRLVDAWGK